MREKNLAFIKEKHFDFARLLKETRLMEVEVEWVKNDDGLCSACGNPVDWADERCPYCEAEFGHYFDLERLAGLT